MDMLRLGTCLASFLLGSVALCQNGTGVTYRATVFGVEPNGPSGYVCIGDGSRVVFQSDANNLLSGTSSMDDVFAFDTSNGQISLVTVNRFGQPANNGGMWPAISTDSRWVGFVSTSPDLTPDDTDMFWDVFVRDVVEGQTYLLHLNSQGQKGNGNCTTVSISADGRFGTFVSESTNLVSGDTNWEYDVFVRDRLAGTTDRASVSSAEIQGNGASWAGHSSADGRYVVFVSEADNLVPGDTNNVVDAFLRDRLLGTTVRISNRANGSQSQGAVWGAYISDSGTHAAITTSDPLRPNDLNGRDDVYCLDLIEDEVTLVSESPFTGLAGNVHSRATQISPDGGRISFYSTSTDLIPFDMNASTGDAFFWDRATGQLELVMVSTGGVQPWQAGGFGASLDEVAMSSDGRFVAVVTDAPNLAIGDIGTHPDVYVRDRIAQRDVLTPTSFTVLRGIRLSGSLGSLIEEDGNRLVVGPGPVFTTGQPQIIVDFESFASISSPTRIEFNVTSSAFGPNPIVEQAIQFYNFQSEQFETQRSELIGSVPTRLLAGSATNPSRFVGPGGVVRARLTMYRSNVLTTGSRWGGQFDLVRWSVIP